MTGCSPVFRKIAFNTSFTQQYEFASIAVFIRLGGVLFFDIKGGLAYIRFSITVVRIDLPTKKLYYGQCLMKVSWVNNTSRNSTIAKNVVLLMLVLLVACGDSNSSQEKETALTKAESHTNEITPQQAALEYKRPIAIDDRISEPFGPYIEGDILVTPSNEYDRPVSLQSHKDLISRFAKSTCPDVSEIATQFGGPVLNYNQYSAYFDEKAYKVNQRIRRPGVPSESINEFDRIRGDEWITKVSIENIDGMPLRVETVQGRRFRSLENGEGDFYAAYESPYRVTLWRDDCQGFIAVTTRSDYIALDPAAYRVHYLVSERKPSGTFIFGLNAIHKPINPTDYLSDWSDRSHVVVFKHCYEDIYPGSDIGCAETNLNAADSTTIESFYSGARSIKK